MSKQLDGLRSELNRLRNTRQMVHGISGLAVLLQSMLLILAGGFLLDWLLDMSPAQRFILLILMGLAMVWCYRRLVRPWFGQDDDLIELALNVEQKHGIDNDLVSALQFESPQARNWGSVQLESAVITQVAELTPQLDVFEGTSFADFKRRLITLAVATSVLVLVSGLFPDYFMSYKVLARKWRPGSFSDVVGQQHILQSLSHALDSDRLHHALLFTGTRGVGKTTIARILAKALNCEEGISSTPCGKCASCLAVDEGRFIDLIEVDAASKTKVDDTRELLDNVQYLPTSGRYKVYLIDEVHMLSRSSFNALLKTLEEPPPHVKFVLATTDPQKVPVTVLSRCLQFNLKRLPVDQIQGQLKTILEEEISSYIDSKSEDQ